MDQVRTSEIQKDGYYNVKYDKDYQKVDSEQQCSNICVSDLNCNAWKYSAGICSTSSSQVNNNTIWNFSKDSFSGKVELASHFSIVQIVVFVIILFLFGVSLINLFRMYEKN